jgi:hypothetical protein
MILHVAVRNGTVGGQVFNLGGTRERGCCQWPQIRPNLVCIWGHFTYAHALRPDQFGRRAAAKLLTKDEAKRIAAKFRQAAGIGPPNRIRASSDVCYCEQTFLGRTDVRFWHKADIR